MAASDDVWDRFIELGHDGAGPIIPADPYHLYLGLRERGFTFAVEAAGDRAPILVVCPPEALTDDDCSSIRRWKWHLPMLMDFEGRPGLDAHLLFPAECPPEQRPPGGCDLDRLAGGRLGYSVEGIRQFTVNGG